MGPAGKVRRFVALTTHDWNTDIDAAEETLIQSRLRRTHPFDYLYLSPLPGGKQRAETHSLSHYLLRAVFRVLKERGAAGGSNALLLMLTSPNYRARLLGGDVLGGEPAANIQYVETKWYWEQVFPRITAELWQAEVQPFVDNLQRAAAQEDGRSLSLTALADYAETWLREELSKQAAAGRLTNPPRPERVAEALAHVEELVASAKPYKRDYFWITTAPKSAANLFGGDLDGSTWQHLVQRMKRDFGAGRLSRRVKHTFVCRRSR